MFSILEWKSGKVEEGKSGRVGRMEEWKNSRAGVNIDCRKRKAQGMNTFDWAVELKWN